jgi:hypothetical protein
MPKPKRFLADAAPKKKSKQPQVGQIRILLASSLCHMAAYKTAC